MCFTSPSDLSRASPFQVLRGRIPVSSVAIANCLAQSEALMDGFDEKGLEPWRVHEGNRPSSTILFEKLDPETLGELIALYAASGAGSRRASSERGRSQRPRTAPRRLPR